MKKSARFLTCLAVAMLAVGSMASACFGGVLPVHQKYQEKDQWCWSASSQAILEYYGKVFSQTDIAQYGTEGQNIWNWLYGSSSNPTRRGINMILEYFASIESTSYGSSLSLSELTGEIDALRPAVVRWGWDTGGGHFVVAYGAAGNTVYLMDPWYGPTVNSYSWVCRGSSHTWTDTLKLDTTPQPALPGIFINGSKYTSVDSQSPVSVTVSLEANNYAGRLSDWWVLARGDANNWFCLYPSGWADLPNFSYARPAYQGALQNIFNITILAVPALQPGSYVLFFGVDAMNGILDNNIIYDSATVIVRP